MELIAKQRELAAWSNVGSLCRQSLITAESVVPDTLPDVGRIVWVQGGLLLKGKELSPGGVGVNGEAWASVLYLTEELGSLESLRLTKPFRLDFETPAPETEALPGITWRIDRAEARALNPRKLSVSLLISAELENYSRESLPLETELPEQPGLHLLRRQQEHLALTGVWEKSFSLREELEQPLGQPCPERILGEELRFTDLSAEQIGARCVLRGQVQLELWGLDGEGALRRCRFRLPFSQLLDTGEGSYTDFALSVEPCACELSWLDGLDGKRMLSLELSALAQLRGWERVQSVTVSDAYSSRMPCTVQGEERSFLAARESGTARLRAEETLKLPEDFGELLSVQPFLEPPAPAEGELRQSLQLDLLIRRKDGSMDALQRRVSLRGEAVGEDWIVTGSRLQQLELRPEEEGLRLRAEAELRLKREQRKELFCLSSLSLDEERDRSGEERPALYLVRRQEGESLWALGKAFGASPEELAACNAEDAQTLLIPAEG